MEWYIITSFKRLNIILSGTSSASVLSAIMIFKNSVSLSTLIGWSKFDLLAFQLVSRLNKNLKCL